MGSWAASAGVFGGEDSPRGMRGWWLRGYWSTVCAICAF